jgi:hypothetical protein
MPDQVVSTNDDIYVGTYVINELFERRPQVLEGV